MSYTPERLYELLPAIYRIRDAEQDNALQMLLTVMGEQIGVVEDATTGLYENWFIETADEWIVAYIADLLGVQGLHPISSSGFSQRARVANTLRYRRRKGTATMLEQLSRDTTLWDARAVEFFDLLETTQYANHIRLHNHRTPDLRDVNRLELLDTPFDTIAHTGDVRRIATGRGKHNIPNIGIFLWRLQNYNLNGVTPRAVAAPDDGRYTFTSIGYDAPLFNEPRTEQTIEHLAEEQDVSNAIRPLAFYLDLEAYRTRCLSMSACPNNSTYYGPDASIEIVRDGVTVPPMSIQCMDLSDWARPLASVTGVLSGSLAPFPALTASVTASTPSINVTIGGEGPHAAVLASVPGNINEAASLLETAIQGAHSSLNFAAAQVGAVDDRLIIMPGIRGSAIALAATPADATTVSELQLDTATVVEGVLSGDLSHFPTLTDGRVSVTVDGSGPHEINLGAIPTSLANAATLLETALQANVPGAQVIVLNNSRLLVLPGGTVSTVKFSETANDPATVRQLKLVDRVGVDVRLGRIAFPAGDVPGTLSVSYVYGFSGDVGGGPYDRRVRRQPDEPLPSAYENTVAAPEGLGVRIVVPTDFSTISAALSEWETALSRPDAVIEIADSRTYEEDLVFHAGQHSLVIQARNGQRPTLIGDITVNGTDLGRLALNGLLIAGSLNVAGNDALHQLDITHCTLVPGSSLALGGSPDLSNIPSVVVTGSNPGLQVNLDQSISGPLFLPTDIDSLLTQDSLIESPIRTKPAVIVPVLVSGSLSSFPALSPAQPQMRVTIGENGPITIKLASKPSTLAPARDLLQAALRSAHSSPAFSRARVITIRNRLVIIPGTPGAVSFETTGTDSSADQLRLTDTGGAQPHFALLGGVLPTTLDLSATTPAVTLSVEEQTHTAVLAAVPTSLAQARDDLQLAIDATPFSGVLVGSLNDEDRLVIVGGEPGKAVRISPTSSDPTTAGSLKLECAVPAIAANSTGEQPGPPAWLERTTVLGPAHMRELMLASEVIFTEPVRADRRQSGCVRFSYVPDDSRTPRRFRCQPDLEIDRQITQAEADALAIGVPLTDPEREVIRDRILEWLVPAFTSTRYRHPAYGQLSQTCPQQIRTGAEDGAEMGVFSFLKQPQREANLRSSLDEYLRFGLEAGIFYVT